MHAVEEHPNARPAREDTGDSWVGLDPWESELNLMCPEAALTSLFAALDLDSSGGLDTEARSERMPGVRDVGRS